MKRLSNYVLFIGLVMTVVSSVAMQFSTVLSLDYNSWVNLFVMFIIGGVGFIVSAAYKVFKEML